MPITKEKLFLPEGVFSADVQVFEDEEREELQSIYKRWINLSGSLKAIHSRSVNIPDGLSEGTFCLATGAVRMIGSIAGANSSFDCYDIKNRKRIQVKSTSVIPDLTSFGPKSVWDELYFLDFYRTGTWDGKIDIYLIPNDYIYENKVNRNQSFTGQQAQGRRPRFSIYKNIIKEYGIQPITTYDLL
jgi:hypothetical protein